MVDMPPVEWSMASPPQSPHHALKQAVGADLPTVFGGQSHCLAALRSLLHVTPEL